MDSKDESVPFLDETPLAPAQAERASRRRPPPPLWLSSLLVFLATSCLWAVGLFVMGFGSSSSSSSPSSSSSVALGRPPLFDRTKTIDCGHTMAEARQNCVYDILLNHWVPRPCADENAIQEYQADGSWLPYADANHTQPLALDELGTRDYYYTNERDHIVHCAMLWRKQYRAFVEGRRYMDMLVGESEHTMHCSQYLIDMTDKGRDFRKDPIKVFVGVTGCLVRGDGW